MPQGIFLRGFPSNSSNLNLNCFSDFEHFRKFYKII
jgi:hypothetical protein